MFTRPAMPTGSSQRRRDQSLQRSDTQLIQQGDQAAAPPIELAKLRGRVEHALSTGSRATVKAFIQYLVAEIRVEDRNVIRPRFRFAGGGGAATTETPVRAPSGSVGRPGLEPGTLGLKVPCSTR